MDISRRDFLCLAATLGLTAAKPDFLEASSLNKLTTENLLYDGFDPKGDVTLLHICDMHAHLKPLYWREPSTLISAKTLTNLPGFLSGDAFMRYYGIKRDSLDSYFDTFIDFSSLAKRFGKMGGCAHLKTVIDIIRKERGEDKVLLLDSGDTWQGTAIGLKTNGEAPVAIQNDLKIDAMVGHWEFTYGKEQVLKLAGDKNNRGLLHADFISQNVSDEMWDDLIYKPYVIKKRGGARIGIVGQSFPYTKTANTINVEGWSFGLRLNDLQKIVDEVRAQSDIVVLLSHDGFSVDQEVARRIHGIDVILSGHTHDPSPKPLKIGNTLLIISGSHGKYISRLDFDIRHGRIVDFAYKLIPVASHIIAPDEAVASHIDTLYRPFETELSEKLATTKTLLYKRDTFYSTFDTLIGKAIQEETGADIVFTPGFRWGTTILENGDITMDDVYDMTAITYPNVYTFEMTGKEIRTLMEDIADNVFNENPLYQQGGDMTRVYGGSYAIRPNSATGKRINQFVIQNNALKDENTYLVSSWGGNIQKAGQHLRESKTKPVYDIVKRYLKSHRTISVDETSNVTIME